MCLCACARICVETWPEDLASIHKCTHRPLKNACARICVETWHLSPSATLTGLSALTPRLPPNTHTQTRKLSHAHSRDTYPYACLYCTLYCAWRCGLYTQMPCETYRKKLLHVSGPYGIALFSLLPNLWHHTNPHTTHTHTRACTMLCQLQPTCTYEA